MAQAVGQKQRKLCMIIKVVVEQMVKLCIIISGAAGQVVRCKFCATFFCRARQLFFFLAGQELITTWFVPNRSPSDLEPQSAHLSCKILVHFFSQCPVCLVSVILEHNTSYIPFLLYRRKLQLSKAI